MHKNNSINLVKPATSNTLDNDTELNNAMNNVKGMVSTAFILFLLRLYD